MLRFALQPPLDEQAFARDLAGWEAYQRLAGPFLLSAARQGSPVAAYHLSLAYSGFPMPGGSEIVPSDTIRAVAFGLVAMDYVDGQDRSRLQARLDRLSAGLAPGGVSAAQASARDLASDHFQGDGGQFDLDANPIPADPVDCGR